MSVFYWKVRKSSLLLLVLWESKLAYIWETARLRIQSKKLPAVKNPSKDIVESGKDGVGYKLHYLNQSAMGAEQKKTEDSGVSNNHILRYKDGGGLGR